MSILKKWSYCECGKVCYSESEADWMLRHARAKKYKNRHKQIPKRKYHCKKCRMWHVTHLASKKGK